MGVSRFSMVEGITTSRRQRQNREEPWEGSPSAHLRVDEQESHGRPSLRVSQHKMTKPNRDSELGKCGDARRRVMFLL